MKNFYTYLKVLSLLLAAVAIFLIAWANWPSAKSINAKDLHLIAPPTWGVMDSSRISDISFQSTLLYNRFLKTGQINHFTLSLEGLPAKIVAAGETWQIRIRTELVLPGIQNQQEGMLLQAVQEGKPVVFDWIVKGTYNWQFTGTLRIYVDYLSSAKEVESQLLSVTYLHLTSSSLLGMNQRGLTTLGVDSLLLSGLIGLLAFSRTRR